MRYLLSVLACCIFCYAAQAQILVPTDPKPQQGISYELLRNGFSIPNPSGSVSYRFQPGGLCSQMMGGVAQVNERSGKWTIRDGKTLELKFKRRKELLEVYYFYGYYFLVPADKVSQFIADTKAARDAYEGKTITIDGKAAYPGEPVLATVRPKYFSQLPPSAP